MALIEAYNAQLARQAEIAKYQKIARLLTLSQRDAVTSILPELPGINDKIRVVFGGAQVALIGHVIDKFVNGQAVGEGVDLIIANNSVPGPHLEGLSEFVAGEIFLLTGGNIRTIHETPIYRILEGGGEDPARIFLNTERVDDRRRLVASRDPGNMTYVNLSLGR